MRNMQQQQQQVVSMMVDMLRTLLEMSNQQNQLIQFQQTYTNSQFTEMQSYMNRRFDEVQSYTNNRFDEITPLIHDLTNSVQDLKVELRISEESKEILNVMDSNLEVLYNSWLATINNGTTRKSHRTAFEMIFHNKILDKTMTLREFNKSVNKEEIFMILRNGNFQFKRKKRRLGEIKKKVGLENGEYVVPPKTQIAQDWLEYSTLLNRSNSFLSFVAYLQMKTKGFIKPLNKPKGTFERVYEKSQATIIKPQELRDLYKELRPSSEESYLICRLMSEGAKRISEVLALKLGQCNFETGTIKFFQLKTITQKIVPIIFRPEIIQELKQYVLKRKIIGDESFLFKGEKEGESISYHHVYKKIHDAWAKAGYVAPKMPTQSLRNTQINELSEAGYSALQIKHISGHSKVDMVNYYVHDVPLKRDEGLKLDADFYDRYPGNHLKKINKG